MCPFRSGVLAKREAESCWYQFWLHSSNCKHGAADSAAVHGHSELYLTSYTWKQNVKLECILFYEYLLYITSVLLCVTAEWWPGSAGARPEEGRLMCVWGKLHRVVFPCCEVWDCVTAGSYLWRIYEQPGGTGRNSFILVSSFLLPFQIIVVGTFLECQTENVNLFHPD